MVLRCNAMTKHQSNIVFATLPGHSYRYYVYKMRVVHQPRFCFYGWWINSKEDITSPEVSILIHLPLLIDVTHRERSGPLQASIEHTFFLLQCDCSFDPIDIQIRLRLMFKNVVTQKRRTVDSLGCCVTPFRSQPILGVIYRSEQPS